MRYTLNNYKLVLKTLAKHDLQRVACRFVKGKIYIKCSSDALFNKINDILEEAGLEKPFYINFCEDSSVFNS